MSEDICQNLKAVQQRIAKACEKAGRDADEITLVAVSKMKPLEDIKTAFGCGQIHFGENRAKELQDKMDAYDEEEVQWHMVGNLQTNKIKYMVERVNWIDSVPKKKTIREIEKRASRIDRVINVLIQVNISGESQKSGCEPEELPKILEYARGKTHVNVRGLMGMATYLDEDEDLEKIRPEFRLLRELKEEHESFNGENIQLEHLSMGMTNDMEVAIEEGSTMVRVGRAIFGERDYS
ncbi:YggS family pyridoxal phosphate-dependent enzyme [Aliifodinibius sp. S!AR15-10]|uniref:YggS family pyridoxal phosphate-dependent enzyme n=1 Tax=Aliifodinibius sp. S!AR15-10 TaxID=2950437 RepID=UPI00285F14CB|nr:YggS family pyridoxal phosphate-dependent enzyme [Aliifodinibius sp. S!AR15-10]MDR8393471.1 YggS family pyridoxal phosphate-dependent enzyme [Aliifodinibius sp. S!AR15-10]